MTRPALVLYGPTASGKSALALAIARLLAARGERVEIVTADAFQVYRGMDIGTAKPAPAERQDIPHHLLDIADPHAPTTFSVGDWLRLAESSVVQIRARGATPLLVGGTSLYVQSFMHGLMDAPAADPDLRARLGTLTPEALRAELQRVDPATAARLHPADTRRAVRAIEFHHLTGGPISARQQQWAAGQARTDARLVILSWPVSELNRRINARVKAMMSAGLLDEVRALRDRGPLNAQAREALGYKQLLAHLAAPQHIPLEDAVERIKIETRRFAKNQRTWIKRLSPGAQVIEGSDPERAAAAVLAALPA